MADQAPTQAIPMLGDADTDEPFGDLPTLPDFDTPPLPAASRMTGLQKAAILMTTVGADRAAKIMRGLAEDEAEAISMEMVRVQNIGPDQIEAVLNEVIETSVARSAFAEGGPTYARSVLEKAFGADQASRILARMDGVLEAKPFKFLQRAQPDQVYLVLRGEQPQAIALILAHMQPAAAAQVLGQFEKQPEVQAEITECLATMKRLRPEVVETVEERIKTRMFSLLGSDSTSVGGVEAAAEIINHSDRQTERGIFERLSERDEELVEEIKKLLFVFEDLATLDGRALQTVVRSSDGKDLALAMRGADDTMRDLLLSNMSERAALEMRETLETMPKQSRKVVEEAQQRIVAVVRALEEQQKITITRGGEEDDLV